MTDQIAREEIFKAKERINKLETELAELRNCFFVREWPPYGISPRLNADFYETILYNGSEIHNRFQELYEHLKLERSYQAPKYTLKPKK